MEHVFESVFYEGVMLAFYHLFCFLGDYETELGTDLDI